MKQEPISCRADNALAARCQSFAARWACVFKRPIFYLAAYIDNNVSYPLKSKDLAIFVFLDSLQKQFANRSDEFWLGSFW